MNKLVNFVILSVCLLLAMPFSGCSSDSDEDEPNGGDSSKYGTLTINGVKHDCYFEYHGEIPTYEVDGSEVWFDTYLFDETGIAGSLAFSINKSSLKKGDITDEVYVEQLFFHYTGPEFCDYLSGSVSIEEKTDNKITVKFNKYKIEYEGSSSYTYTIDGKVIYTRQ